jgi:monoamine oxidase
VRRKTIAADYCICAMPLTLARTLDADFGPQIRGILDKVEYDCAYKVAWEAPRFWETEANIYGGISYLQQPVDLVWYPSARLFSEKGILIGGYSMEFGPAFPPLPMCLPALCCVPGHHGEWLRLRASAQHAGQAGGVAAIGRAAASGSRQRPYKSPSTSAGARFPGTLARGSASTGNDQKTLATLQAPDRRIYFAGDHTSHIVGWQEGAALSAHRVIPRCWSSGMAPG